MNHQNIDENPYAPPKSAADFRQPENGTKKQRRTRVVLGALSFSTILAIVSFLLFLLSSNTLATAPFPFAVVLLFFIGWLTVICFSGFQSIIFAIIIEYHCSTWIHQIIVSIVLGIVITGSMLLLITLVFDSEIMSINQHKRLGMWLISGVISALITIFIMNAHRKRCYIQSLTT